MTSGSFQRISLGPATATDGAISTARSNASSAAGCGALSWASSQSQSLTDSAGAATVSARSIAAPKSALPVIVMSWAGPDVASNSALRSVEPASTATTALGRRVWRASSARVRSRYAAPDRATSIAVTLVCILTRLSAPSSQWGRTRTGSRTRWPSSARSPLSRSPRMAHFRVPSCVPPRVPSRVPSRPVIPHPFFPPPPCLDRAVVGKTGDGWRGSARLGALGARR